MLFREIAAFEVHHTEIDWPWIAFSADRSTCAFATSPSRVETRRLTGERVEEGPAFALPADVAPSALSTSGAALAVAGKAAGADIVLVVEPSGETRRARVDALLGERHEPCGLVFDRTGRRLWLSAETPTETVTALLDASSLAVVGVARTPAFPRPALHELHIHTQDDAVLVLAACGEEGTFARVVGFAGDEVSVVPSALDAGAIAAGFVGFSADAARIHLVELDELRTHAWPTLHELSSVPLADDFVSSFSGAVFGHDILVDGQDADTQDDAVMAFDQAAIHGHLVRAAPPAGMWAGRLGPNALVTVESKGDPARARIFLVQPDSAAARRTGS